MSNNTTNRLWPAFRDLNAFAHGASGVRSGAGQSFFCELIMEERPFVACRDCARFVRQTESWEMPHIAWWECAANVPAANLKSFPFKRIRCAKFQPKGSIK